MNPLLHARPFPAIPLYPRASQGVGLAAAIGTAVFVALLWPSGVLNDGDTLLHIQAGTWILAHRAVPHADPFSFTFLGRPWVAHEWLAEVMLALAYGAAGWSGLMALTAAAAGVSAALLTTCLRRFLEPLATLLLLALAATAMTPALLARPHILALPCLVGWCGALVLARARGTAPPLWLLPLMTLWANLHGGFMVGLALAAALGLEDAAEARPHWRQPAVRWGVFLAGGIVAASITPQGPGGLLFPFALLRMHELAHVQEWVPSDFSRPTPVVAAVLLALYFGTTGHFRLPRFRALLLIGLVFATFQHSRNAQLLATIGSLLVAGSMGERRDRPAGPVASRPGSIAVLGAIAALALAARLTVPFEQRDSASFPVSALAHLPSSLSSRPVLNGYGFGGFLIFSGIHPFIDGRADMYGDDFLRAYLELLQLRPGALEAVLAQYRIAWTILPAGEPITALMDRQPGWRRIYADRVAVVHVRDVATASSP